MLDKAEPFEDFNQRLPPAFRNRWTEAAEKDSQKSKNIKKYTKKLEEMVISFLRGYLQSLITTSFTGARKSENHALNVDRGRPGISYG